MIRLLAIRKNISLDVREKFALNPKKVDEGLNALHNIFDEVVILNTCNRTEIYFNSSLYGEEILRKVFEELKWDLDLIKYVFYKKEEEVYSHLLEVVCGFKSRILGEDQILGQIKNAYAVAKEEGALCNRLQKLFEIAIGCGKKFRTQCKMYEIPVSSASIVTNMAFKTGKTKFMLMGFGEIGKAVCTNILANKSTELLYIVVRNKEVLKDVISDKRVRALNFGEKDEYIKDVECIIGATSAPHSIVRKENISKAMLIFDLAVPRDIDINVKEVKGVELYDIDEISMLDDENKKLRIERMNENKYLLEDALKEYLEWEQLRDISSLIREIKIKGDEVWMERFQSFKNKSSNEHDNEVAEKLFKSIVNTYTNRAIELLKEERLKGSDEGCLRVIKKIFLEK